MKEKEFEVIVPAYDALESELEDILGGGCFMQSCHGLTECKPQIGGACTPKGNITSSPETCCPGLIGMKLDGSDNYVCVGN